MRKSKSKQKKWRLTAMFSCLARMKSPRESMISIAFTPIYRVYARFCQETTIHGLKHTVERKLHWFERLLWLALTIVAFAGAVYCALSQWYRYNSEPVVVSLQRDYRVWWTTFPAITACFLDRVMPDKAKELIEKYWNVTEESDPTRYQHYMDFIELVADVSFRNNLQNFWKYQNDETVKDINLLELALAVHPNWTLEVSVSQKDHEVHWHQVMTEVGLCWSFNSVYAEHQFVFQSEDWTAHPLLQCHYHSGQCFVRMDSQSIAVRYFIHSPYEISTAISNPTGEVLPGEELIIDFKVVEIQASPSVKNLRTEQRRCKYPDEWITGSIRAYSFSLCQMHCRSRMAVMFCGCRPYFHVKGVLPYGLDVGLFGVTAYYMTKLKKPEPANVISIFGPEPRSKEGEESPERVVRCIAHRGAGLDAPENTMEAFRYCVSQDCNMVELDVRTSKDGKLVLLHDEGLQRLTGSNISNVHVMDWDKLKDIDVGLTHPNRAQYKEVHLCLLDDALDYLLAHNIKVIIDVKGQNQQIINGILKVFATRPNLYEHAAVTSFNPFVLYQIRKNDPEIVGALSYRPYCFSAQDYDAEQGALNLRYGDNLAMHTALRAADVAHALLWRWCARWCSVSAVLLHKDIVNLNEIRYWRNLGIRCAGWCVNRPLEKLYWRAVLKAPYLANTLVGEPEIEKPREKDSDMDRPGSLVDSLLEPERKLSSGQN